MKINKIINLVILCMISLTIGGCNASNKVDDFSGDIKISGSTSMKPLVEEVGKKFTAHYPNVKIDVGSGGSVEGVNEVFQNYVEIGDSSVEMDDLDEYKYDKGKLIDNKICLVGFAVVVNKENKIDSLSENQIEKIFNGQIKNWKEVGGENLKIDIVHRSKKSGSRKIFEEKFIRHKKDIKKSENVEENSFSVVKHVSSKKNSIGYVALPYLKDNNTSLKAIKINNIVASNENIILNKYPFWSYGYMYTLNEPEKVVNEFIKYMGSNENKSLMEKLGYIPIDDLK